MSEITYRIGLLGHGTVGGAFSKMIEDRGPAIREMTGLQPVISGILTRSQGDFRAILEDSDVIVELIGGIHPAYEYITEALEAGRHVISANKQLLAQHGQELEIVAASNGVQLRFEAAVAGVVPVVRVLQESFPALHINKLYGIVNGTTNFILSEMEKGMGYDEALAEAQSLGYAEADPTEDVNGKDAAAKMAILAKLAYGASIHLDQVSCSGIEDLQTDDLQYAQELGLSLKLLGVAERINNSLSVRVHPAFLQAEHPLASIKGTFNAVTIEAPSITEVTLSGPGAGGVQTASSVLGDLGSIMAGCAPFPIVLNDIALLEDIESAFYIHIEVADRPGVLAVITKIMSEYQVSVGSVIQKGKDDQARLIIVTHPVLESSLFLAIDELAQHDFIRATPRVIRVIA